VVMAMSECGGPNSRAREKVRKLMGAGRLLSTAGRNGSKRLNKEALPGIFSISALASDRALHDSLKESPGMEQRGLIKLSKASTTRSS
jgi:hypothetical protein